MKIERLLNHAATADLYDLLAATLNALVDRDEELTFNLSRIETRFADIAETDGNHYTVSYYAEGAAELALAERELPEQVS